MSAGLATLAMTFQTAALLPGPSHSVRRGPACHAFSTPCRGPHAQFAMFSVRRLAITRCFVSGECTTACLSPGAVSYPWRADARLARVPSHLLACVQKDDEFDAPLRRRLDDARAAEGADEDELRKRVGDIIRADERELQ
eukprot:6181092-Pleurochrysis_carterae.AAC.4